mmetsp:Transcript_6785/g.21021  ORF Transcript_6785/g.21021 Transcript_6785/m.21021 type:complete len:222 (+) Transcript_6785:137-802(+)
MHGPGPRSAASCVKAGASGKPVPPCLSAGRRGNSSVQSRGPKISLRLSRKDGCLYGLSPEKSSSTAVMFLPPIRKEDQNMPPVMSMKTKVASTPTAGHRRPLVSPAMLIASIAPGRCSVRRKTRLAQNVHQFSSTKCLWLRHPTQVPIHGQWWSMRRTQQPHSAQWCARSGRGMEHFLHHVAFPGCHSSRAGATGSASPTFRTNSRHSRGKVPGSARCACR